MPRGKVKPKKTTRKVQQPPEPPQPPVEQPVQSEGEGDDDAEESDPDNHPRSEGGGSVGGSVEDQGPDGDDVINEKIADFFEQRTYFYDISSEDYKNKQRRNFELAEFAALLGRGWTGDRIWRRFLSLRTDYGKLRGIIQKGKSGRAPPMFTPKQKWKLARLTFLNPYMKRGSGFSCTEEELGKVSISQNKTRL